jgi:hypothetical protein
MPQFQGPGAHNELNRLNFRNARVISPTRRKRDFRDNRPHCVTACARVSQAVSSAYKGDSIYSHCSK